MQKLKKIMTILAIAGTVLVTALFCYMPIRDIINQKKSREISLAQNNVTDMQNAQAGGDKTIQENNEASDDKQSDEKEQQILGTEIPGIELTVRSVPNLTNQNAAQEIEVTLWQSTDGTCYFFLPGFADEAEIALKSTGTQKGFLTGVETGSIQLGNSRIQSGDILKDIAWDEPYDLTVYDKNDEPVFTAPVIFMCSSQLPILSLTTDSGTMDWIHQEKGNEEPGAALLLDENGNSLLHGELDALKGRGNSTWGLAKKPYQMKLKDKADIFGFGEAKDYNLLANGYDETRLRNEISVGLAKELGMEYVPEGRMIDLYINGIFYGNYYLCEKVQVEENRVAIRDMEETAQELYKAEELIKLEHLQNEDETRKWTDIQYEEPDITGGYLFERELNTRFHEEVSGFVTTQGDHYALQSPAYASKGQVDYIADLMQEFQDAIEQENGVNPETGKHYSEYIDVNSFIQKYLVDEIAKNYDGGVTSSFFYKPQDSVSTKIFAGPVWDYDVVFGNCDLDEIVGNPIGITKLNNHVKGTDVFARLYEQSDFYNQMISLYEEKALPYLNALLDGGIDALVAQSRQSEQMDSIRWESLENRYQYYENYDNSVKSLKHFIEKRRDFLSDVWLEGAVYHNVTFVVDGEPWKIACVKDGELVGSEPIPHKENAFFVKWLSEKRNVAYDEFKPVYEDVTFYALWQELSTQDEDVPTEGVME